MKTVLVTGANGFIGKNLTAKFKEKKDYQVLSYDIEDRIDDLYAKLKVADFLFHLAGVNRPVDKSEFYQGNSDLTEKIVQFLNSQNKQIPVVFSSSTQVIRDNEYAKSKLLAEESLQKYKQRGGQVYILRLPNVFGKWSKPNYNSAVATFCYNIAREIPIEIHDPSAEITLIYIDDLLEEFFNILMSQDIENNREKSDKSNSCIYNIQSPLYTKKIGEIADLIYLFKNIFHTIKIPDMGDGFIKKLYATYLSFLPESQFAYDLRLNTDERGHLFEFIKSEHFGQIFISSTKPGITRGNHYHHTKVEKFCVIRGQGIIQFRQVNDDQIIEYAVSGAKPQVVDIPPGYTHNISNAGSEDMITIFWSNEIFNPEKTDTFFLPIKNNSN